MKFNHNYIGISQNTAFIAISTRFAISCDLYAICDLLRSLRDLYAISTAFLRLRDLYATVPIATGTDRHKIARDEFY